MSHTYKFDRKAKRTVAFYIVLFLIAFAIQIILSYALSLLIDYVIVGNDMMAFFYWVVFFVTGTVIYHIFNYLVMNYLYFKFEIRITNDKAKMMMAHLLKANYTASSKKSDGFLFNAILIDSATTMGIRVQMNAEITSLIISAVALIILLAIASPIYLVMLVVLIPLFIVLTLGFRRKLARLQVDERENIDKLYSLNKRIIESKRSINLLKANPFFLEMFNNSQRTWTKFRLKYLYYYLLSEEMPVIVTDVSKIAVMAIGGYQVIRGVSTLGELTLSLAFVDLLLIQLKQIMFIVLRKNANKVTFDRVEEVFRLDDSDIVDKFYCENSNIVEIKDVNIAFDNGHCLNIDHFFIKDKGLTLLEGENGSGKSTVFNLVTGYYQMDNIEIKGYIQIKEQIKNNIAYLSNPNILIEDTIKQNILLGKDESTMPNLNKVLDVLNCKKILEKQVTIYPLNLSYGEQQKISIARILAQDIGVYLLDEPYNNLDKETQEKLCEYLHELSKYKSVVIVTHDSITKSYADVIYEIVNQHLKLTYFQSITNLY